MASQSRATEGSVGPFSVDHGHVVQFYENDAFLCRVLTDFSRAGLDGGESVVLIAGEAHRAGVHRGLSEGGLDVDAAVASGQLTLLDARAVLDTFMVGGMPSWELFAAGVRRLLARVTGGGRRVRLYGEMVDLLWRDGNHRAAIGLEEMWTTLLKTEPASLLCGYSMDNFVKASDAAEFGRICDLHTDVQPSEGYAQADAGARSREVALLQQRARALETEVRRRHELEVALRRALDREQVASQAKDQFLALLGHELRNPLGAIVLAVDLMNMQPGSDGARERRIIEHEVKTLVRLVDDLLDAARAMHGGVVPTLTGRPGPERPFGVPPPEPDAAPPAAEAGGPTAAAGLEPPAHALKVLVVDDNVHAARIVGEAVRLLGHHATVVHDGAAAMSAPAVDVAVLDIGLPGINGYDLARRIRERVPAPGPYIVALTGYGEATHRAETRQAGFDAHLVKPIDFRTLRDLLNRVSAERAAKPPAADGDGDGDRDGDRDRE